jgi:hypothetical protein
MVLTSDKCQLNGRSVTLAASLAILMSIAPHEASAKGGMKMCCLIIPRAEAAPTTSSRTEPKTETLGFGGCGGKRYRDPITHRCRGPANFGN